MDVRGRRSNCLPYPSRELIYVYSVAYFGPESKAMHRTTINFIVTRNHGGSIRHHATD